MKATNIFKISGIFSLILSTFIFTSCFSVKNHGSKYSELFEMGVGVVDITPSVGYAHYSGTSTGVATSLNAKAIVFKQGENHGAILVCDIASVQRSLSRIVREKASEKTGIPFQNISVSATHTHTGPSFSIHSYAEKYDEGTLTEKEMDSYVSFLVEGMTEAIVVADRNRSVVEMWSGIGEAEGFAFNRRYLMTDGKVRSNPGRQNPKTLMPVGPTDPDVQFVLFRNSGQTNYKAVFSTYACHTATIGGTEFHADYPYFLETELKKHFGDQLFSIFGLGTSGDINTTNVEIPRRQRGNVTLELGSQLAEAIIEESVSSEKLNPSFKVVSKIVYMPLQDYTDEEYEWAIGKDSKSLFEERTALENRRKRKIRSLAMLRGREAVQPSVSGDPWRLPVEIHVFRLDSQNAIVTMPGEIFAELGLNLKARSPFNNTMIVTLSNASIVYVPTSQAFLEGDYEAINSRLAPGSGEQMVDEVLDILRSLKK